MIINHPFTDICDVVNCDTWRAVLRPRSLLRYYFPTYENDALLCTLSDSDEDEGDQVNHGEDVPVIAEDISNLRALKQTSVLNQLLKNRSSSS